MLLSDYIRVYEQIIPESLCDVLIHLYEQGDYEHNPSWPALLSYVFDYFKTGINKYFREVRGGVFPPSFDTSAFTMKCIMPGEHTTPYVDVGNPSCFLKAIVFLNDLEDGDIIFPHPHVYVMPRVGRMLVYPPYWMYPCAEQSPTQPMYVMITNILYPENKSE